MHARDKIGGQHLHTINLFIVISEEDTLTNGMQEQDAFHENCIIYLFI